MGGQSHTAVGIELFVIASTGALSFLYGLTLGSIAGLYVVAAAILLNVAFMISAAWLLVVGVYTAKADS